MPPRPLFLRGESVLSVDAEAIAAGIARIRERIAAAATRAGRSASDVTLVAVSKTFPAEAVDAAVAAGARNIGENRVQELRDKYDAVKASPSWHLIGHLQTNKARDAVRMADVIESVDSLHLAQKLSAAAAAAGKTQRILLQVNVGREPQKGGLEPEVLAREAQAIAALPNLAVEGLMAIPPLGTPEESRQWFAALRRMRDELAPCMPAGFVHLSMGMSEDFEVAIEEGATLVRVGRAIFGAR